MPSRRKTSLMSRLANLSCSMHKMLQKKASTLEAAHAFRWSRVFLTITLVCLPMALSIYFSSGALFSCTPRLPLCIASDAPVNQDKKPHHGHASR